MTKENELAQRINKLFNSHLAQAEAFAAQVREQFVLPICRKYHMLFIRANKDYWFRDAKCLPFPALYSMSNTWEAERHGNLFLLPVLKLLSTEYAEGHYIGQLVKGVYKEDLE